MTDWSPPPPPSPSWWGRRTRRSRIAIIVVAGLLAVGTVGSLLGDDEPEPEAVATTDAVTTTAPSTTSPPTTSTTTSTTSTTTSTSTSSTTSTTTTTIDPGRIATATWALSTAPMFDELSYLSADYADAAGEFDLPGAVIALDAMIALVRNADPPPPNAPNAVIVGWDVFTDTCIEAWATSRDAMAAFDVDGLERGTAMLYDCTDALDDLASAFGEASP